MASAKKAYERLIEQLRLHRDGHEKTDENKLKEYKEEFLEAINDDLNVPMALGVLWKMLKEPKSPDIYQLALDMDKVFGLDFDKLPEVEKTESDIPEEIKEIAEKRLVARKEKNWAESDRLRDELKNHGYSIKDTSSGYELNKI
jgi:Cysteinyl-tRNA synthetase